MVLIAVFTIVVAALPPSNAASLGASSPDSSPSIFYAFAHGAVTSPSNCPLTAQAADECTLAQALALVPAGGEVLLANGGGKEMYFGNFSIATPGTSIAA